MRRTTLYPALSVLFLGLASAIVLALYCEDWDVGAFTEVYAISTISGSSPLDSSGESTAEGRVRGLWGVQGCLGRGYTLYAQLYTQYISIFRTCSMYEWPYRYSCTISREWPPGEAGEYVGTIAWSGCETDVGACAETHLSGYCVK